MKNNMKNLTFGGLGNVNIELTNRCNKKCWICGRRKVEVDYPELTLKYGDMDFSLVKTISEQLPPGIVVQLHNNGEALLYPRFGDAVRLFRKQITNIVTNGKLLVEKADDIINNLDTLAISIIEKDPEANDQYRTIKKFLKLKGDKKPFVILRINGKVNTKKYKKTGLIMATRILHSPMGSFNYRRNIPTIPEIGMCWDFLHHLAINKDGLASICVRFDPKGLGVIGDTKKESILKIWNGSKRTKWLNLHKQGLRSKIPLCSYCHFWGVPTSGPANDSNTVLNENKIFDK
jgi:hypothetical protein